MGRASRVKRDRKQGQRLALKPPVGDIPAVYHFLSSHVDSFLAGDIFISTLSWCRSQEKEGQGDREEGHEHYYSGNVTGDGSDPDFQKIATRMQMPVGSDCYDISFIDSKSLRILPDAFVLCTSEHFMPAMSETFGKFCVEIREPRKFFRLVTQQLAMIHPLYRAGWGRVKYLDRQYTGLQDPPGPLGFVKPKSYGNQDEVRFLWIPKDATAIKRFTLSVPDAAVLCRRIKL
jgi:hypothetical protein